MKKQYQKAVLQELEQRQNTTAGILREEDLIHLPEAVQRYIRLSGSLGKEKIQNFRAEFRGGMRFSAKDPYMSIKSVQYNFYGKPSRLFYITAKKSGIPALGLHIYRNACATFKIKIMGLFTVVDASGPQMDQGETVTVFNDMCFIAPATLIDPDISWEVIDEHIVKATYTNAHIRISATLHFDNEGRLINFISHDRYETNGKEYHNYPWSTPVSEYREVNGFLLPSNASMIYERPDGPFCYGEFELHSLEYNCKELK
jgi:hypothetical protein